MRSTTFYKCGDRILALGLAVLVSALLWGCDQSGETRPVQERSHPAAKPVSVSAVEALPPRGTVEYVGVLSAFRKADVASEIGGTVERLFFEKGDRVKEGQVMAEVSTRSIGLEVRQAAAALAAAESQLEKARRGSRPEEVLIAKAALAAAEAGRIEAEKHLERVQSLYRSGSVSDSALDAARRAADTARAQEASARQQLRLAEEGPRKEDRQTARANVAQAKAGLALARDRLRKSRLSAPFAGVAAFREVEPGEVIPPGTVVTRVVELDRMKIKLSVNEKDLAALKKSPQLAFSVDALAGEKFNSRLIFLSPTATAATRSFPAELLVIEPDPRMADGMTARVELPLFDEKKAIKVPSAWLAEENGRIGLFVVRDRKADFRAVTLGAYYDQRVEILAGLAGDEEVITNPAGIKTGDTVTVTLQEKAGKE